MTKRSLPWLFLVVGLLPFLGCASIMKGGDQKVRFESEPSGASISVYDADGQLVADGKTPAVIPLKKGYSYFQAAKYRVEFSSPGCAKKDIWLTGSLEGGWYIAGNFLIGGLVGWLIVDPLTGAMWTMRPSTVNARLEPILSSGDQSLRVALASEVSEEVLANAVPLNGSN